MQSSRHRSGIAKAGIRQKDSRRCVKTGSVRSASWTKISEQQVCRWQGQANFTGSGLKGLCCFFMGLRSAFKDLNCTTTHYLDPLPTLTLALKFRMGVSVLSAGSASLGSTDMEDGKRLASSRPRVIHVPI